jgi:hypothetical protein
MGKKGWIVLVEGGAAMFYATLILLNLVFLDPIRS